MCVFFSMQNRKSTRNSIGYYIENISMYKVVRFNDSRPSCVNIGMQNSIEFLQPVDRTKLVFIFERNGPRRQVYFTYLPGCFYVGEFNRGKTNPPGAGSLENRK